MEWTENEEINNDRCSTASSSNSGELVNNNSNGSTKQVKNSTIPNNQMSCNASTNNLDSMSDGELSDFSLNDSDDDELRSSSDRNSGKKNLF